MRQVRYSTVQASCSGQGQAEVTEGEQLVVGQRLVVTEELKRTINVEVTQSKLCIF